VRREQKGGQKNGGQKNRPARRSANASVVQPMIDWKRTELGATAAKIKTK
jgi:hypothetical protein